MSDALPKNYSRRSSACKFATDALLNSDFKAFINLLLRPPANPNCEYPSYEEIHLPIITKARVYHDKHPINMKKEVKLEGKITKGMPTLHQIVLVEGSVLHNNNKKDFSKLIDFVVKNGGDINRKEKSTGNTALHYATEYCRAHLVNKLIELGGDMTIKNNDGNTPIDTYPRWCTQKLNFEKR